MSNVTSRWKTKCRTVGWEDDGVDTSALVTGRVTRKGSLRGYVTRLLVHHAGLAIGAGPWARSGAPRTSGGSREGLENASSSKFGDRRLARSGTFPLCAWTAPMYPVLSPAQPGIPLAAAEPWQWTRFCKVRPAWCLPRLLGARQSRRRGCIRLIYEVTPEPFRAQCATRGPFNSRKTSSHDCRGPSLPHAHVSISTCAFLQWQLAMWWRDGDLPPFEPKVSPYPKHGHPPFSLSSPFSQRSPGPMSMVSLSLKTAPCG